MILLRQILLGLALLGALAGYYLITEHRIAAAEARATSAEATAGGLRSELATAKATERVITRYVDRVQVITKQGATITREVPVYVTPQADAACVVPAGFVRLHDAAAAAEPVPSPAGAADARPSGVALSAVAGTVADNYTTCQATAAQLIALQDWARSVSGSAP